MRTLYLIFALILSLNVYGQKKVDIFYKSSQDSLLLKEFWTTFKTAINTENKEVLTSLCKFPFYCRPCLDYASPNNELETIKVSKQVLLDTQYKMFFDKPLKKEVNSHKKFDAYIFHKSIDEKGNAYGFKFSYMIWQDPGGGELASQGFIYLEKINGKYKITAIDTVP